MPSWLQQTYSDFCHLPSDPFADPSPLGYLGDQGLHPRQGVLGPLVLSVPVHVVTMPLACKNRALCNGALGLVGFPLSLEL